MLSLAQSLLDVDWTSQRVVLLGFAPERDGASSVGPRIMYPCSRQTLGNLGSGMNDIC